MYNFEMCNIRAENIKKADKFIKAQQQKHKFLEIQLQQVIIENNIKADKWQLTQRAQRPLSGYVVK